MSDETSHKTTDHATIRKWAESRDAKPAKVAGTADDSTDPGILRLDFPEYGGTNDENLELIDWDTWFRKFDESKLALVYQEKTADGKSSNFNKLVSRN